VTDWDTYSQVSQAFIAPVTAVGVLASLYIGVRTLRELRDERMQRGKPVLRFDGGGYRLPARLDDSYGIPGIDPAYARKLMVNRPKGKNRLSIEGHYTNLKNHGLGPALDVSVTFIPYRIFIGEECFVIDTHKRREMIYSEPLNTVHSHPNHISAGGTGSFGRIPTPLVVDFNRTITQLDCVFKITCHDVFKVEHVVYQGVRIMLIPEGDDKVKYVHFVFLEEMDKDAPDFTIFGGTDSASVSLIGP
jgi:hypothetical protein